MALSVLVMVNVIVYKFFFFNAPGDSSLLPISNRVGAEGPRHSCAEHARQQGVAPAEAWRCDFPLLCRGFWCAGAVHIIRETGSTETVLHQHVRLSASTANQASAAGACRRKSQSHQQRFFIRLGKHRQGSFGLSLASSEPKKPEG